MCIYELLVHMPILLLITGALLFSFNRLLGMLRIGMFLRLKQSAKYSPLVLEGLMIEFSRLNKFEEPKDSYNISLCSSCWFEFSWWLHRASACFGTIKTNIWKTYHGYIFKFKVGVHGTNLWWLLSRALVTWVMACALCNTVTEINDEKCWKSGRTGFEFRLWSLLYL